MSDDFCLLHGYEYMKSQMGNPIPYCEKCDRRADAMSDDISEIVRQLRTGEAIDRTAIAATLERLSAGKEEAFQWADKFKARAEAAEARLHAMSDDDPNDLAEILLQFTNHIMNERVRSYNEGFDAGRKAARFEG